MIHCHMLDHEDDGLMAQFAVVDPRTKALPAGYKYVPAGGPAALAAHLGSTSTRTTSAAPLSAALVRATPAPGATGAYSWWCADMPTTRRP
jgi:hypothetical protein